MEESPGERTSAEERLMHAFATSNTSEEFSDDTTMSRQPSYIASAAKETLSDGSIIRSVPVKIKGFKLPK